ncbi:MAG: adenylate kinase [Chloroflexi bacterium]|nr:adenylate kinase [Chloroflexota bacterium]
MVLLGPPGAGKGTQAARLAQAAGLAHLASGDLFREHLSRGTELGKVAQAYMTRGELVPDDVTTRMIAERLAQPDAATGAVFDGFPRTVAQAEGLDRLLAEHGERVQRAVVIDARREELVRRLTGRWLCRECQTPYHQTSRPPRVPGRCDGCGGELYQRPDDTVEVVERRLAVYEDQTQPLLAWYERAGVLARVDGERDVEAVQRALARAIAS